jgi:hypothetical protein
MTARSQAQQDAVRKAAAASAVARQRAAASRKYLAPPVQRHDTATGDTHVYRALPGAPCTICAASQPPSEAARSWYAEARAAGASHDDACDTVQGFLGKDAADACDRFYGRAK